MVNIPRKFTEDEVQSIVDKYLSGLSLEGVAKDLQCSPEGVRAILVRVGVPRRGFGRAAKPIGPTKVCSCCGIEKSRSEFTRNGTKDSQCKVCLQLKQLEKYHSDEEFKAKAEIATKAADALLQRHGILFKEIRRDG